MILVVTPLPLELEALRAAGLAGPEVRLELGGHGKVQFALRAQSLVLELQPRLVICAGACGSLVPAVKALDVVVAEDTVEHDFRLRFVKRPLPRFAADGATLARLRKISGPHFGTIASGDEDVIDPARAAEIARATGALAVAWEGAGGARACLYLGVPFIEIRGVTDSCALSTREHFRENLKPAMGNVARLIRLLASP